MATTIKVDVFSQASIDNAIKELDGYRERVRKLGVEIAKRLSQVGYDVAFSVMSGHIFSGETIGSLQVVELERGKYMLTASSTAILFFEFGAGARYGNGHPMAGELGMGPGTYPGAGHWDDPNGWMFPTSDSALIVFTDKDGQGWGHTYGNPPHMPFYNADMAMREAVVRVALEVVNS